MRAVPTSSRRGNRAKVTGPANRGVTVASRGPRGEEVSLVTAPSPSSHIKDGDHVPRGLDPFDMCYISDYHCGEFPRSDARRTRSELESSVPGRNCPEPDRAD